METIYLGLKYFSRECCSETTDLDSYFTDYSKTYSKIMGKKKTMKNILNTILPDMLLTDSDIKNLDSITDENELKFFKTNMKKRNPHKKKDVTYKRINLINVMPKALEINKNISNAVEIACSSLVGLPMKTEENLAASNVPNPNARSEKNECGDTLNTLINNLVRDTLGIRDLSSPTENCVFFQNSPGIERRRFEIENATFLQNQNADSRFSELCLPKNTSNGISQFNRITESMPSTSKGHLKEDYFSEGMQNEIADNTLQSSNNYQQARKNRLHFSTHGLNRCQIKLDKSKTKKTSFGKGERFLVSFRIHYPFKHKEDEKPEKIMQEILLLDINSLENLRDKIICHSDYQDVQGDLSESPDASITFMSRDIYPSAMFYLDNTFYIDSRYENCRDYSTVIRSWALPRGIPVGETKDMSNQLIGQLKLRFGYPYLYMHQGCCEHLVIINDARMVTGKDPLKYQPYPLMSALSRNFVQNCGTCSTQSASWLVEDRKRMLLDINYMCKTCFTRFYYKDGRKIGNFKAFRFYQGSAIL